jgi:hypothetical protein
LVSASEEEEAVEHSVKVVLASFTSDLVFLFLVVLLAAWESGHLE